MIAHREDNLQEFLSIHHNELEDAKVARTVLFSEYVNYCKHNGATGHANMVQFCKECAALADSAEDQRLH